MPSSTADSSLSTRPVSARLRSVRKNRMKIAKTASPRIRPPPPLRKEKNSSSAFVSSVADTIARPSPASSRVSTSTLRSERRRQTANPITATPATRPAARSAESSMRGGAGYRPVHSYQREGRTCFAPAFQWVRFARHARRRSHARRHEDPADRVGDPDALDQPDARPAGRPGAAPEPGHDAARGAGRSVADLPDESDRAGGFRRAAGRDPRRGARDLQAVAPHADVSRASLRARARYARTHLLQ